MAGLGGKKTANYDLTCIDNTYNSSKEAILKINDYRLKVCFWVPNLLALQWNSRDLLRWAVLEARRLCSLDRQH
jgi:hypothetical protein